MKTLRSHLKKDARYLSMGQASSDLGLVLGAPMGKLIPFYEDYDHSKLAGYVNEDNAEGMDND